VDARAWRLHKHLALIALSPVAAASELAGNMPRLML